VHVDESVGMLRHWYTGRASLEGYVGREGERVSERREGERRERLLTELLTRQEVVVRVVVHARRAPQPAAMLRRLHSTVDNVSQVIHVKRCLRTLEW
jgi:hypothetical protein